MTDSERLKYLKIGAIGFAALLLLDRVVISPAMAGWSAQSDRIDTLRQKVQRGRQLLERKEAIRARWADMERANMPTEVSAAEDQAFQSIGRWAITSGISVESLTPQWLGHDEGYQTLEYRAAATGTQAALARFIYELEIDPAPVNLEEFEITTRDERGTQLTMTARFSFLRLPGPERGSR